MNADATWDTNAAAGVQIPTAAHAVEAAPLVVGSTVYVGTSDLTASRLHAFAGGGALDYVREGETGCLFHKQSSEDLATVMQRFDVQQFDSGIIRQFAVRFDQSVFQQKIRRFIDMSLHDKS